jgi:hypothetical protein
MKPLAWYVEAARSRIGSMRPDDADDAEYWDGLTAAAEALAGRADLQALAAKCQNYAEGHEHTRTKCKATEHIAYHEGGRDAFELVGKWIAKLATTPSRAGGGEVGEDKSFVLTMRSGVSSLNDNVIGSFRCYATALSVGGFLMQRDAECAPEYRIFDIVPIDDAALHGAGASGDFKNS